MDIKDIVRTSILECIHFNMSEADFSDEVRLGETIGLDSISYVQVVVTIEDKIGISLSDEVLNIYEIKTFSDLCRAVEKSISEGDKTVQT
ncbi:acyl carrier protein [Paenibacillus camerounensis]|uniref:acyl carrier protein n=1 Tax=Paenibacillus camerounensis TaxID=1243663 RepID=UPI0005AB1EB9|nr:phosphopantetheine-binding protein [Paenibacillus camerounensis]